MNRLKWRIPSPAMVIATVALFVALGGGAYASVALNQVKSVHIKNGEVKNADLATAAVTSLKIANNSVNSGKVANGTLELGDLSAAAQAARNVSLEALHRREQRCARVRRPSDRQHET